MIKKRFWTRLKNVIRCYNNLKKFSKTPSITNSCLRHCNYYTPNALKTKLNLSDFTKLPFSTMHISCRSLLYKLDDVQSLLAELTVSVLALTETWFDSNSEEFVKNTRISQCVEI